MVVQKPPFRVYVARSTPGLYNAFSRAFSFEEIFKGALEMKQERNVKMVGRGRKELKNEEKTPYTRPRLTSYGPVERFTGGKLS